jgi:glycosyltransferase involved in cell wall biosynthesis
VKKKLLYIGNKLSSKGTVTTIETLSNLLSSEGYVVVSVSSIQNKIVRLLDMLWSTFKYRNKVDVVLIDTYSTQNFYYAVAIAKLCRSLKIPYLPILHGGNLPQRLVNSPKLSQKLFKGAKTNITPSHYLLNAFKEKGYTNLTYIPNTIEIKCYPFLERNKIHANLLWVRSFSEIYNPKLALEIVEKLVAQNIEVNLCMVGPEKDGSLKECQEIVAQKKLPVTFTGLLSKKEWIDLSKDYDLFINTTNFDNTPVSVIEAMALGLPVISTNVGGIPYLIEHGKTGVLVSPNNSQAFVDEIQVLFNNPSKAIEISKNARIAVEKFDWEVVKGLWNNV